MQIVYLRGELRLFHIVTRDNLAFYPFVKDNITAWKVAVYE